MAAKYYIMMMTGGTEIEKQGPFDTYKERDAAAREMAEECDVDENVFFADVDADGSLHVGAFDDSFDDNASLSDNTNDELLPGESAAHCLDVND